MHSCDKFSLSWLVFNMLYLIPAIITESSTGDFETFSDNNGNLEFNHLVVDKDRGWVFLGAVNRLYQLFPNLTLKGIFSTRHYSSATDNYNKILVLDYNSSRLIACGSYSQGLCHIYKIKDSLYEMHSMTRPIVSNSSNASTVAFIAPNPFTQNQTALYVGVTYSNSSVIPAVATRSLKNENLLKIMKSGTKFTSSSMISIRNEFRNRYIINYVYGFSSESYIYFLTTQMNSTGLSPYISKLIRICQQHEHYNSYIEIPIGCTDKNGTIYNLAQAASVTTPSLELAKSLGIEEQDVVLFGIFAQSKQSVGHESNKAINKSALCIYSLKSIKDKFADNIQNCNEGNGYRGLEYILLSPEKCNHNNKSRRLYESCDIMDNLPLGGHLPAQATSIITFDTLLTAVTAISKSNFTFVIVGTHTGHLKQIIVKNTSGVWECNDIVIDDGSPINPDTQFDSNGDSLYVMTEHKLTKINVINLLPSILHVSPDKGPWEGGTNISIQVENFGNSLEGLQLDIKVAGIPCTPHQNQGKSSDGIVCVTNEFNMSNHQGLVEVQVNGIPAISQNNFTFVDPKISKISFENSTSFNNLSTKLIIEGENLNVGNSVAVFIGETACPVCHHDSQNISCVTNILATIKKEDVMMKIDGSTRRIVHHPPNGIPDDAVEIRKYLHERNNTKTLTSKEALYVGLFGGFIVFVLFSIILYLFYRKKYSDSSKKLQERMNKLELRVATECKEAFAELQTETNFTTESLFDGLPFLDYNAYVMKNLFPNMENHSSFLNEYKTLVVRSDRLKLLDNLIKNRTFLLRFIRTLESNENFSMNNRVSIASILMITLHNNMDYCTDILETLMVDLIEKYTKGKSHPKLLLRQTESIVEKMLSIWFTFLLYKFLKECAGKRLFTLFMAIKQHINKGPVDMITSEARYSLNQEKLIRQHVDYHLITVFVNVSQQTAIIIGLKSAMEMVSVTVLDCDTITQVKEKALNIIFYGKGYSRYPKVSELELKWMAGDLEGKMLYDSDSSSRIVDEWKQINTLLHYGVPDGAKLNLLSSKEAHCRTSSVSSDDVKKSNFYTLRKQLSVKQQRSDESTCLLIRDKEAHAFKEWHLVQLYSISDCGCTDYNEDGKMVSEIYLTRLLATKLTMQRFVDDLFKAILIKSDQNHCFPTAIKYMFDFLDDQAAQRGITDPEVVHIWKNNCLPLRFWVNLIKNPNFLFDIHKSNIIDSCLNVIAQAFIDSCSTSDHKLGKDSPTSKLLFAKDIPHYKNWVRKYYLDISAMPAISRKYAKIIFEKELLPHANDFNTNASICELYKYMSMYKKELIAALREDQVSQKDSLANNFEEVIKLMSIA